MSPALAGRYLTTGPSGKSYSCLFNGYFEPQNMKSFHLFFLFNCRYLKKEELCLKVYLILSQKEKDKHHMNITYMWNLNCGTNEPTLKTETVSQTQRADLLSPSRRKGGSRTDREFGVGRCKRLHLEGLSNKDILNSTGNYIQYPGINRNEKEH